MSRTRILAFASLLVFAVAPAVRASEIVSGLLVLKAGDTADCDILNVATSPMDITVQLFESGGTALGGPTTCHGTSPDSLCGVTIIPSSTSFLFCRATVPSKKKVRATWTNDTTGAALELH